MNKKSLVDFLTTRIVFVVAVILVSCIAPGVIALVVSMITQDVNYIVTSCLAGTWISVVLTLILISKFLYKKRIKSAEIDSQERVPEIKRELIRLYSTYIFYFSLIIGFIFFELQHKIINGIQSQEPALKRHRGRNVKTPADSSGTRRPGNAFKR